MTKTRVLFLATVFLLFVGVVFFIGTLKRGEAPPPSANQEVSVESAKEVLEPVTYLTGTVRSVSGGTFVLDVRYPEFGEDEASLRERTVTVGPETTVVLVELYDEASRAREAEEFDRKTSEYQKAVASGVEEAIPPPPPVPASRELTGVSALALGQTVNVFTETDVRTEANITPQSIEIFPQSQEATENR